MNFTKILSAVAIGLSVLLVNDCMATGPIPINTPQSGVLTFNTNGATPLIITNSFVPAFTYPPVMTFFLVSGVTNALPFTNNFVTTTNFSLQLATPTNCAVAWTAFAGYPRVQTGTNLTLANAATNIAFAWPYAQIPTLNIEPTATNVPIAVTAVTLTNFTVSAGAAEGFIWGALGIAATPGTANVTY
jgi:hypothetical protein